MSIIAVLGALDTKGEEFSYLIDCIRRRGHSPFTVDTSVMEDPGFTPDIGAARVAQAGGAALEALRERADRGEALQVMARGAEGVITALFKDGRINGVIGMGGSGGTSVFAAGVRSLPVGFPKLLITTLASGDTSSIVGVKDLVLFPPVVDIAGLNRISRRILANAAGAICGMVEVQAQDSAADKPLIAATMLGNTTEAVDAARKIFENAGYEVLVFHAVGSGGRTMESLIADGLFEGVFDFTTTELASELAGSPMGAGPGRLKAAVEKGLPLVIVPGCTDFSIFRRPETIPEKYSKRHFYPWNPEATLMRTTPEESAILGRQIAKLANSACGPAAILLPLRGLSLLDVEGQPYWWPEADAALFTAIRAHLRPDIPLIEMDLQINDPAFARRAAETLLELMANKNTL